MCRNVVTCYFERIGSSLAETARVGVHVSVKAYRDVSLLYKRHDAILDPFCSRLPQLIPWRSMHEDEGEHRVFCRG